MSSSRLTDLSPYVYGTTRLGDDSIPFTERVKIARAAMEAGVWFHTSHQYGDDLKVLKAAFDEDRSKAPKTIFKIGWSSVQQIRGQIEDQLAAVGFEKMAIGQLCLSDPIAMELRTGGPGFDGLLALKEEGLVERFVLETWPWNSENPLQSLKEGRALKLVDGLIFYLNPLQRFVTNELWDLILAEDVPVIAMRTVAGGDVNRTRDNGPEYLRKRATEVIPLFERSGCTSWAEFAVRYVYGFPQVRTTVGATSRREALEELQAVTRNPQPLPDDIQTELIALQRRWSDEHDRFAAQWSM